MADLSTPAESPVAGLSIAPFFSGIDVQQHAQSWCGFVTFDQDLAGGVWAPTRAPSGGLRARSAHQKRPSPHRGWPLKRVAARWSAYRSLVSQCAVARRPGGRPTPRESTT